MTPRRPSSRYRRLLLLAGLALLPGCAVLEPDVRAADRHTLRLARARWRAQGISSYRYVFSPYCECPPATTQATLVTVQHDTVVAAAYLAEGPSIDIGPGSYSTMGQLFDALERAYANRAADVRVQYDDVRGHPVQAFVDPDRTVVDDEYSYSVSALTPIGTVVPSN